MKLASHTNPTSIDHVVRLALCLFLSFVAIGSARSGAAQTVKFTSPLTFPAGRPFVVSAGD
ncbi:MAG TPA: hypothetical protein VKD91_17145, partial [Pyrinomonadaceae bacterium]|nr:hypothetical protein [Pyrinomonadaceae bacterium]